MQSLKSKNLLKVSVSLALLASGILLSAQAFPSAHDAGMKVGVQLGYPTAFNVSYRFDKDSEVNAYVGYRYGSYIDLGANYLIRLASLMFEDDPLPLSLGPQVIFGVGQNYFQLDALANLRLEASFRTIPLNLFIEAGLGMQILPSLDLTGSGALGVRLILDHPSLRIEK